MKNICFGWRAVKLGLEPQTTSREDTVDIDDYELLAEYQHFSPDDWSDDDLGRYG
jgi:hypothetical protein